MDVIVAASRATDEFKADLRAFLRHDAGPRVVTTRRSPAVKVQRVLAQLLATHPELEITSVRIDAHSGCSDFSGVIEVEVESEMRRFEFTWCCRWRAEQEGFVDYFGFPDQIRAANEFGWRCFRDWREMEHAVS
ncbi:MAG: hypothetical protein M3081_10250 [Gemmatimonadota bacterium]|nr:hypothetical protein [Gemmatimonadota bacterium]